MRPSPRTAAVAMLFAAWILSGGCGLVARPLAHGLVWCVLALAAVAWCPGRSAGLRAWIGYALGLAVALMMIPSANAAVSLAGIAFLVAAVSAVEADSTSRTILRITAQAIALLALYRFALVAMPLVWHLSEVLATAIASLASALLGRPLSIGPTFAGLDHLVLMTAFTVGWARQIERPRIRPILLAVGAIVLGQMVYLLCLSLATELADRLPTVPPAPPNSPYIPPDWAWADGLRSLLPWNMPLVAVAWQLAVATVMLRTARFTEPAPSAREQPVKLTARDWKPWLPLAIAALLPIICVVSLGRSDLKGKTILVFDQGFLDWNVPEHGSYGVDSAGRFGMLPKFVESLGGRLERSEKLTDDELAAADVLVLLHPNQPWPEERLARVQRYVRQGGSLLVAAGPRRQERGAASSFNDVLQPLGLPVRFDTAVSETAAWRHGLHATTHPTAVGLGDDRDRFGVAMPASMRLPWHAQPILIGRWGWSDPGSDYFLTESGRWDAGERLGDLVLAAERRHGAGRVVALGDTACLTNQGNVWAYRFTGRLLSYLARGSNSPQTWWRQLIGLALVGSLIVLWFRPGGTVPIFPRGKWDCPLSGHDRAEMLPTSILTFALLLVAAQTISTWSWEVHPDGRGQTPNNLAYLDAAHLPAYSESPWLPYGIDGLALTLMRDDYLVLAADDLSAKRLNRAAMLVTVGPARGYSGWEKSCVHEFVDQGGILIAMAGATHGRQTNPLLEPYGISIPPAWTRPGEEQDDAPPLGCIAGPYPEPDSQWMTLFHAAWPIDVSGQTTQPLAWSEEQGPIAAIHGSDASPGIVVAIGDTHFAANQILERADGSALTSEHVNAHFWRWLLSSLTGEEAWEPPIMDWGTPDPPPEETQP